MQPFIDPVADIRGATSALVDAGYDVPSELSTALDTCEELTDFYLAGMSTPTPADYEKAILSGDVDGLRTMLTQLGTAKAVEQPIRAEAVNYVKQIIAPRLRRMYTDAVKSLWTKLVTDFNATADKFMSHADTTDINAPAEELVGKPQREQKAWLDSLNLTVRLDELAALIERAAVDIGYPARSLRVNRIGLAQDAHSENTAAGLFIAPRDASNKDVYTAWTSPEHRCGRWGALLDIGVGIVAPEDITDAYLVSTPRKDETKYVTGPGGGAVPEVISHDYPVRKWRTTSI